MAPKFYLSQAKLAENLSELRKACGATRTLSLLSVKACPAGKALQFLADNCDGFDIAGSAEFDTVTPYLNSRHLLSLTGPIALTDPLLKKLECLSNVKLVHFETDSQSEALSRYSGNFKCGPRVRFIAKNGSSSRFGVNLESIFKYSSSMMRTLHIHIPSKIRSTEVTIEFLRGTLEKVETSLAAVDFINLGGGFERLEFSEIRLLLEKVSKLIPSHVQIVIEPGELWFRDSISCEGEVLSLTPLAKNVFQVVTSISKICHLHWSSNPRFEIELGSARGLDEVTLLVVGPTCAEEDISNVLTLSNVNPDKLSELKGTSARFVSVSPYSIAWSHRFNGIEQGSLVVC